MDGYSLLKSVMIKISVHSKGNPYLQLHKQDNNSEIDLIIYGKDNINENIYNADET